MLNGHTVSALLADEYRAGAVFDLWQFQRGLTSCLFLLLSGFAFSIATSRHWATHTQLSGALTRRLRRFALFIVLGYALHLPVSRLAELPAASDERWQSFLAVDVLQLIGVSLVVLQLLVLVSRRRRVFTWVALSLAALVVAATPFMWRTEWRALLPLAMASFLSPSTGSLFPLFPWMGYVLLGAGLGQLYGRRGADVAEPLISDGTLLALGGALIGFVVAGRAAGFDPFGAAAFADIPAQVVVRTGSVLLILGVIAYASRRITHLPHLFRVVAQESLVIYFVHLCVVYGTVWNRGLTRYFGRSLSPIEAVAIVVALVAAMVALAWVWNSLKHARPRTARAVSVAIAAWLLWLLV